MTTLIKYALLSVLCVGLISLLRSRGQMALPQVLSGFKRRAWAAGTSSKSQIRKLSTTMMPDPATVTQKGQELSLQTRPHRVKSWHGKSISYALHQMPPENVTVQSYIVCPAHYFPGDYHDPNNLGERGWGGKGPYPPQSPQGLLGQPGVIDFKTSLKTTMNTVFIGDSLSLQGMEWFSDGLGVVESRELKGLNSKIHVKVDHTPHGSINTYYFARSLLVQEDLEEKWFEKDYTLLRKWANIDHFEVCINRIPVPHIKFNSISTEMLDRHFERMQEMFGCGLIIVTNVAWHNNIMDDITEQRYYDFNRMLASYITTARKFNLVLLDMDQLTRAFIENNARELGMTEEETYRVRLSSATSFQPLQAVVCRHRVPDTQGWCWANMISSDGMHWCPESIAGRYNAAVACLIQCHLEPGIRSGWKQCRINCEEFFLSLKPLPFDEWQSSYPIFGTNNGIEDSMRS